MWPVVITAHEDGEHMRHIAWSPAIYHINDIGHPLTTPSYENFCNRINTYVANNNLGPIQYTYTDFHSETLINDRGDQAYFTIFNEHVISPVFFIVNAAHNHANLFHQNTLYIAQHHVV
jgi:hypothetical protein